MYVCHHLMTPTILNKTEQQNTADTNRNIIYKYRGGNVSALDRNRMKAYTARRKILFKISFYTNHWNGLAISKTYANIKQSR